MQLITGGRPVMTAQPRYTMPCSQGMALDNHVLGSTGATFKSLGSLCVQTASITCSDKD